MEKIFKNYSKNIINQLSKLDLNKIIKLERILFEAWKNNNKVFINSILKKQFFEFKIIVICVNKKFSAHKSSQLSY